MPAGLVPYTYQLKASRSHQIALPKDSSDFPQAYKAATIVELLFSPVLQHSDYDLALMEYKIASSNDKIIRKDKLSIWVDSI